MGIENGQAVCYCTDRTDLVFGRVKGREFRNKWLWLNIEWQDGRSYLEDWYKASHVAIVDIDKMKATLDTL